MAFYNSLPVNMIIHNIQYYVETVIGRHHSESPTIGV